MKLEEKMKNIADKYFVCKKQYRLSLISSGENDYDNPYYIFCEDVELAFNKLDKKDKFIINNEYFFGDYFEWWKQIYKKKDFIQLRKIAIKNFLRLYYEN